MKTFLFETFFSFFMFILVSLFFIYIFGTFYPFIIIYLFIYCVHNYFVYIFVFVKLRLSPYTFKNSANLFIFIFKLQTNC